MIRTGADFTEPVHESPDVCIIGAGAGGSAAALALAQAGLSVLVLEGGGYFRSEDFTQREREMVPAFHAGRGARFTLDGSVNVLGAEMIGGSTVINQADCVAIPASVLEKWEREHGITGLSATELQPAVDFAYEVLGANRIRENALNENNRLLMAGSRKLGYEGAPFLNSRIGCVGCGYCHLACAYDAKQSALITWVPRAEAAGAVFYANCRVTAIRAQGRRVVEVVGEVLDPDSRERKVPLHIVPGTVVLSAGTINSAALLLKSGIANSSGQVGKNLLLQPQMPVSAVFDYDIEAFRGTPQAYAVEQFNVANAAQGDWGFRLEGIFGTPGLMAAVLPDFGEPHQAVMREYRRMAACLVLVPDEPSGEVRLGDDGRPAITYSATVEWRERMARGAQEAVKCYLAAGARDVLVPCDPPVHCTRPEDAASITERCIALGAIPLVSAHPQGTCRMGADPKRSVVDSTLKAHDLDNLYVMDASVFPSTASSHIQIPIMSVSWLCATRLAATLTGQVATGASA